MWTILFTTKEFLVKWDLYEANLCDMSQITFPINIIVFAISVLLKMRQSNIMLSAIWSFNAVIQTQFTCNWTIPKLLYGITLIVDVCRQLFRILCAVHRNIIHDTSSDVVKQLISNLFPSIIIKKREIYCIHRNQECKWNGGGL